MSKTAFYFKTQADFERIFLFVEEINQVARNHLKVRDQVIRVKSQYLGDPRADAEESFIPYSQATNKRYIGTLIGNKHTMNRANIDPVAILKELKLERVQHNDNLPKYTGPISSLETCLTGYQQFKKLTSVFNDRFGHGNWKIHGPKQLQKKLAYLDNTDNDYGEPERLRRVYPNGIKVKIIAHEADIDINKYIFKIALMT